MSADHLQFLKNKFISDYEEAVKEFREIPLRRHFQDALKVLQAKTISPSTPIRMKDCLYDLNCALTECRILAENEHEQERTAQDRGIISFFRRGHSVAELWFLRRTGRKLLRIKGKLQGMRDDDAAAGIQPYPSLITAFSPRDFQFFDASKIHGFQHQLQKMEALLLGTGENGVKAIGIVGMGGSGKTALAQMIFHSPRIQKQFDPMIWVGLPQNLNLELSYSKARVISEILKHLSKGKLRKQYDLGEMLRELHSYLFGRKYLIVLDNVWHGNEWCFDLGSKLQIDHHSESNYSRLSHGLPRESGGAAIVTSRLEEVARGMVGEHNLHRVQTVSDAEACWSIFMDSIHRKRFISSPYPSLLRIKEEVIDRCDGLPSAAKTLAEIISVQIGKEGFWSDPTVGKCFRLRLDMPDANVITWKAREKIETFEGVEYVSIDPYSNEIVVVGRCHPVEIASKIGKSWTTELVSVELLSRSEKII